jgi:hypothetical protein
MDLLLLTMSQTIMHCPYYVHRHALLFISAEMVIPTSLKCGDGYSLASHFETEHFINVHCKANLSQTMRLDVIRFVGLRTKCVCRFKVEWSVISCDATHIVGDTQKIFSHPHGLRGQRCVERTRR